ncbi:hypothetical protein FACS1894158_13980 [Betaproteobacteria bacterium]|nr:hypothetical protein FACS1894158_13980 [Betaproteobacteria bacterium]
MSNSPDDLPDDLAALDEQARVCQKSGDLNAALACYEKALRIDPRHHRAFSGMGMAFANAGWEEDAIRAFETALAIEPDQLEAINGLGIQYKRQGRFDRAMAQFDHALALCPDDGEQRRGLQRNRAMVLGALGRLDEEEAVYRKILARDPADADAHSGLASLLLLTGRLPEGWREYEWRFATTGGAVRRPASGLPRWSGETVARESSGLIIYTEQGFGDALQFSRFVPPVAERFGRVRLYTRKPLWRLFEHSFGALAEVVAEDMNAKDESGFTHHCPLLSLPLALGTTLESIPADVPYIAAPPGLTEKWSARLKPLPGRKVGVVWAGGEIYGFDRLRTVRLKQLESLLGIGGISWVSLQKGNSASQIAEEGLSDSMLNVMDELDDFADTAALIEALDLVISVDTATAHLAGALAKPVWLLNRAGSEWRWLLGRNDSPWYPTMRIFRQQQSRQWEPVVREVAEALQVAGGR